MSKFDEALVSLREEIYSLPEIQDYFEIKKQVEKSKELQELDKMIRKHQKLMCENKNNDEIYFKEKELYGKYSNELNEHPLYKNYLVAKEAAEDVLLEIREQLQ